MIIDAPCFAPYSAKLSRDRLTIATLADLARPDRPFEDTIEVLAMHSTGSSGRGPATAIQLFDEMAFVDPATSTAAGQTPDPGR